MSALINYLRSGEWLGLIIYAIGAAFYLGLVALGAKLIIWGGL